MTYGRTAGTTNLRGIAVSSERLKKNFKNRFPIGTEVRVRDARLGTETKGTVSSEPFLKTTGNGMICALYKVDGVVGMVRTSDMTKR